MIPNLQDVDWTVWCYSEQATDMGWTADGWLYNVLGLEFHYALNA